MSALGGAFAPTGRRFRSPWRQPWVAFTMARYWISAVFANSTFNRTGPATLGAFKVATRAYAVGAVPVSSSDIFAKRARSVRNTRSGPASFDPTT